MTTVHTTTGSPLGELLLVGELGEAGLTLTSLSMGDAQARPGWRDAPEAFADVVAQLDAYFAGTLTTFDIPLTPGGTEFQQRVWAELDAVEYGTSTTYGAITRALDLPRERVQAVGAAIGANPVLVVRPCHRVIGADGSMRGYAGGVDRKVQLLSLEGVLQPTLL
ncbi:MAG: methylated-DNA--[protein]-cysteine S-methyltransferase [Pseudonocardia sp.]|uniref:methylated-DNA--[protein]-cysteine S-methyltransferase n=1 Tax=unclassified Pseudonocardia TaxID=2619320 RepID=UPI000869D0AC|nr:MULTISPECIES: methylated-DNA--[protein]-cysteine S-methyltransferase [unclassified Pseudonocardia]MBN9112269.1 methylated-DNA--[protein]-cysteine S-methyltransferase [Pseudonocardia sp.]ODU28463.1 MAG: cysteine methyltransferase [Pseudonocardia sp. SCN 72-51]ODU99814.1 MAG: cysteine methyltransferase [Pseudonocardia sp. SCN 73-27]